MADITIECPHGSIEASDDAKAAMKELLTIRGFDPNDPIPTGDEFMRQREALRERAGLLGRRRPAEG